MAGRSVRTGRLITFSRPAAVTGGPRSRYVPEDIERLWDGSMSTASGGRSSPGLFGVAPPPQQTVVIFPPEYLPPPQSTMFQPYTITVTNAVQTLPLWTFQVPRSSILIIKDLDIYATNTTTATQVVFSLLVNGAPYPGYGQMNIFAAVAAMNARSFNDLTLRFTEGQTVQMQVQNIDGGNYQVAAGAQGWMYPRVIGEKYANAVGL